MPKAKQDRELLERAWAVLIDTARAGKTITYGELATVVGLRGRQRTIHSLVLTPICSAVCRSKDYPDIASLVVRKDTGKPGGGWWASMGGYRNIQIWHDELESAHSFAWPDVLPIC